MKIAFVYDAVYPYVKGGVEKRICELSNALAAKGHDVHLFGMQFWKGPAVIEANGATLHGVCSAKELYNNASRRNFSQPVYFSTKLLKPLLAEKFDIIDCQNFPYIPCFTSKLAASAKRKPLVITWHEFWENYWFDYLGWKGVLGKAAEALTTKLTPHNIANSQHTKNKLQKFIRGNTSVIPNGITLQKLRKAKPAKEKFDVLFAGRLLKEKNVDLLLHAVAIASKEKKLNCLIVGEGPEKKNLQKLATELQLQDSVKFSNFLPEEKLYAHMKSSSAFVLPSSREGFGMVALEAMACSCPLVTVNEADNAAKDLVQGGNGFVTASNAEKISEKILALAQDKNLQKKMGKNATSSASKFDWAKIAQQLEGYYLKVLNE